MSKPTIQLSRVFPVTIGTISGPDLYYKAIQETVKRGMALELKMEVTSKAKDLMWEEEDMHSPKFFGGNKENVLLADVSVEELGLPNYSGLGEILNRGISRSVIWRDKRYVLLTVRPEELLMLRLSYLDQPVNEWLRGAMNGIEHPMGNKMILRVVRGKNGVFYLDTDDGGDDEDVFDDHVRFLWRLVPVTPANQLITRIRERRKAREEAPLRRLAGDFIPTASEAHAVKAMFRGV